MLSSILNRASHRQTGSLLPTSARFFSNATTYDVAVIGGGPGGYVAAIKAAQLGLKTVCIEKRGTLGGTCLNVGCIPSKALLNITHKYHEASHDFSKMGIELDNLKVNMATMQKQKEKTVKGLTVGIEMLFKANKVDYKKGIAKFVSSSKLSIQELDGSSSSEISAKNFIIATGSESSPMPGGALTVDEKTIITSTGALLLQAPPKKMVIIGGGVIGLEMGSVYSRLGTEVVVVEFMDRITPGIDGEVSTSFQKILQKQGFTFMLGSKVTGATQNGDDEVVVHVEDVKSGKKVDILCDKVLMSVGRRPYTKGLGLEDIGIEKDEAGRIVVGEDWKVPNHPNILAIGDVIRGVSREGNTDISLEKLSAKAKQIGGMVLDVCDNVMIALGTDRSSAFL